MAAGNSVVHIPQGGPTYTAPAAHAFAVAPASHNIPLAPAGHSYIAPANESSSGIGAHLDKGA